MVFVLKPPVEDSKGIVIFTHKERAMIDPALPFVGEYLSMLKDRYVLGMHWGAYQSGVLAHPAIDFHMSGPKTVEFAEQPSVPHYHLCSRNFLPPVFRPMPEIEKQWDILTVTNFRRLKNTRQLFEMLKKLLLIRPQTTALIICTCNAFKALNPVIDYVEMQDDYQQLFSPKEQEQVRLLILEGRYGAPLSQEQLAEYYNASRVFTLFTDVEGESRVISEATLCGLPVVVKSWLKGGGRDYLNDQNSRQFNSLDEAPRVFADLLNQYEDSRFDPAFWAQELCEIYTAPKLEHLMRQRFEELNIPYKGECEQTGLSNKLPGHIHMTLPLAWRSENSNDLNSPAAAVEWMGTMAGCPPATSQVGVLTVLWKTQTVRHTIRRFLKRPGDSLRQLGLLQPKPKKVQLMTT